MTTRAFTFILLIAITWLIFPETARAQNGACPGGSYLLTRPHGTWPDDLDICAYEINYVSVEDDPFDNYPCDQYIDATEQDWGSDGVTIAFVPEPVTGWGHYIRINFLYWGGETIWPPPPSPVTLRAEYITAGGEVYSTAIMPIDDFPRTSQHTGWVYYDVYVVDFYLQTPHDFDDPVTGYVRLNFDDDEDLGIVYVFVKLASIHVGWLAYSPEHCSLPFGDLPATPTLIPWPTETPTLPPTWTPTGTYYPPTNTPTWTPGPTSVGGTITPLPTRTPIVFSTLSPLNTPTPWPTLSLPTLSIPTIAWPDLAAITPSPVIIATEDGGGGGGGDSNLTDPIEMIATQWANEVQLAATAFSPSYTVGITTADQAIAELINPKSQVITPTYGALAPPIATLTGPLDTLSTVISFFRSIQLYFPTIWPLLYAIIIAFGLVIFTYVIQFIAHWAIIILEWIRRLWEAIPLN